MGFIKKPEITDKKMKKIFKQKKELEELTGMQIEKIYVFGECYWGKNTNIDKAAVCFLVDERVGTTVYAAFTNYLRKYRRYYYRNQDDCLMELLMKIYIEK